MDAPTVESKSRLQSRTILFNTISAGVTVALGSIEVVRDAIPSWGYLVVIVALNMANYYLRTITTQPVK